jgi:hypothetical protein
MVQSLVFGPDNRVYMGGIFTSVNGVAANSLAVWNGSQWSALTPSLAASSVTSLAFDQDGLLYVGGILFDIPSGTSFQNILKWNGNTFLPSDIVYSAVVPIQTIRSTADGLYVGWGNASLAQSNTTSAYHMSATVITNTSTITNSPIIKLTGSTVAPVSIYGLVNHTTGKWIYFVGVLQINEVITINTMQGQVNVTSNVFGSRLQTVLNGSDVPLWALIPGQNIIGFLANRSDATITIEYQEAFGSLDDSVWKAGR